MIKLTFRCTYFARYFFAIGLFSILLYTPKAQAQECIMVESPTEMGENVTFYAYAYHLNQFQQELRVSPVFKVSFNYDPRSGVDYIKVALRMSKDFMFFVRDMRADKTHTSNPILETTQNKGVYVCANRGAVAEHRIQRIEDFEALDRPVIIENGYDFEYKFNQYYKASTRVSVTKL